MAELAHHLAALVRHQHCPVGRVPGGTALLCVLHDPHGLAERRILVDGGNVVEGEHHVSHEAFTHMASSRASSWSDAGSMGSTTVKVLPTPTALSTRIWPP